MHNPLKVCRAGSRGHFSRHHLTREPAMFTCVTKTRIARNHAKFKDDKSVKISKYSFHEVTSHFYSKYVVRFQWFTLNITSGKFTLNQSIFLSHPPPAVLLTPQKESVASHKPLVAFINPKWWTFLSVLPDFVRFFRHVFHRCRRLGIYER